VEGEVDVDGEGEGEEDEDKGEESEGAERVGAAEEDGDRCKLSRSVDKGLL